MSLLFIAITLSLAVKAGIVFDGSPGTGAPPPTLGGLTMIPVPVDNRPLFANESFISVSNSCPAQINFGASMNHRRIGNGWATWSHGYTGDVYYNNGVTTTVITLPACSRGVYFYVEPDPFGFLMFRHQQMMEQLLEIYQLMVSEVLIMLVFTQQVLLAY